MPILMDDIGVGHESDADIEEIPAPVAKGDFKPVRLKEPAFVSFDLETTDLNHQGGGFCPNSTTYCSFGCCGNHDSHHCCYPFGIFIGCGFGVLGAICLLISVLKYRLGSHRNQTQRQQCAVPGPTFDPEFGRENQAYLPEGPTIPSVTGSRGCPKYSSNLLPPSYEAAMAGTDGGVIENAIT